MEVDEKSMIRNRYNRIPHPFPDTIRESNILNCTVHYHKITCSLISDNEIARARPVMNI